MRQQTFNQKYREWMRGEVGLRASLDDQMRERHGYKTCALLDRWDTRKGQLEGRSPDIHLRITWRNIARHENPKMSHAQWLEYNKELTQKWRLWGRWTRP